MTAVSPQVTPRSLLGTLTSNRAATIVAVLAGAVILLLGGFALATGLRGHTPRPQQIEMPTPTSPGAGP
jgi:hypothetical protein